MALQVWLPLTKDLRNQGLSDVTVTNNGATFNSAGKLGGCYSFGTGASALSLPKSFFTSFSGDFSIACWVKIITWNSSYATIWAATSTSASWSNIMAGLFRNGSSSKILFCIGNDSSSTQSSCITSEDIQLNTWYHFVCTYTSGKICLYQNGNLVSSYSTSIVPKFSTTQYFNIGKMREGTYQTNSSINDFRIYDHCLSPMEVKELSKGLVLHYSFSDDNLESTTNLVTREDGLSDTCYNGATSKYSYGTNTDMYKTVGTFQNRKSTKVYMGTAGLDAYPYVYFDAFNAAGAAIQTLSFNYFPTLQNTIIPYSYNGTYNFSYTTNKTSGSNTNASQIIIPVEIGKWNHITITAQKYDTTNTSRGIGYIRIGSAKHTSNTSNYWLFNNVQVEMKDHATGYAGVGGTRASTIVYDASGFCNNGTISGALTVSNNTPKYNHSIQMPAAAIITHDRCLDNTSQEWSCAAWVKPTVAGNYQNLNNFNESNRLYHGTYPLLYLNSGTNDYYNYGNLALPINQWSHIVFVFKNSTGTKLIYINGENHTNTAGPNKTSTPKGIPDTVIIGGGNYDGGLCDYREYATALSASDVKSLYQNCATIDADGTIHGQIRS